MNKAPHSSIQRMDHESAQSSQPSFPFEFVPVQDYTSEMFPPVSEPLLLNSDIKPELEENTPQLISNIKVEPEQYVKVETEELISDIKPELEGNTPQLITDVKLKSEITLELITSGRPGLKIIPVECISEVPKETKELEQRLTSGVVGRETSQNNTVVSNVSINKQKLLTQNNIPIASGSSQKHKNYTQQQSVLKSSIIKTGIQNNDTNSIKYPICPDCKIIFENKTELSIHLGYPVSPEKEKSIIFTTADMYETQRKQSCIASCKQCRLTPVEDPRFHPHLISHCQEQKYVCRICAESFIFQCQLKKHCICLKHTSFIDIRPKTQEKIIVEETTTEKVCTQTKISEKMAALKCPSCSLYFEYSLNFEKHLGLEAGSIVYKKTGTVTLTVSQANMLGFELGAIERVEINKADYDEQGKPKQCHICLLTFANSEILNEHKCNHKDLLPPYSCEMSQCTKQFLYLCQLGKHKTKNNHIEKYRYTLCPLCSRRFTNASFLRAHINEMHDNTERFDENYIIKNSKSKLIDTSKTLYDALQSNIVTNHYTSEHCSSEFTENVGNIVHSQKEHSESVRNSVSKPVSQNERPSTSMLPAMPVKRHINDSKGPPSKKPKFRVFQECVETSRNVVASSTSVSPQTATSSLFFGLARNSEISVHKCPFCSKYMRNPSNALEFKLHLNIDGSCNVKNYKISIPLKKFEQQIKFQCDICNLKFSNFELYAVHKQNHNIKNPRIIKCKVCSESKLFTCYLTKHQKSEFHDADIYECSICSTKFCNIDSMREHLSTVHDGLMNLNCQVCKEKFSYVSKLHDHLVEKHKIKYMTSFSEIIGIYIDKDGLNKCNLCQFSFKSEEALEKHLESFHHCVKPDGISCPLCEYQFSRMCFVYQHVALCHADFSFLDIAEKTEKKKQRICNDRDSLRS